MYQDRLHPAGVGAARPASKVPFVELLAPAGYVGEVLANGLTVTAQAIRRMAAAYSRRRVVNATIRELSGLGDRALADIGIPRDMIATVAERVVDGNAEYRPGR